MHFITIDLVMAAFMPSLCFDFAEENVVQALANLKHPLATVFCIFSKFITKPEVAQGSHSSHSCLKFIVAALYISTCIPWSTAFKPSKENLYYRERGGIHSWMVIGSHWLKSRFSKTTEVGSSCRWQMVINGIWMSCQRSHQLCIEPVIIEKSRGEVSLMVQDTIENFS